MAIDYSSLITDEQKKKIVEQRIGQFAAEAWQHEMNKKTCEHLNDESGVSNAVSALTVLEAAINVHQAELSQLG